MNESECYLDNIVVANKPFCAFKSDQVTFGKIKQGNKGTVPTVSPRVYESKLKSVLNLNISIFKGTISINFKLDLKMNHLGAPPGTTLLNGKMTRTFSTAHFHPMSRIFFLHRPSGSQKRHLKFSPSATTLNLSETITKHNNSLSDNTISTLLTVNVSDCE